MRRGGWALIYAGTLILAFLGYQLFVTDLLNDRVQVEAQAELETELEERRSQLPEPQVVEVAEVPDAPDALRSEPTTDPDSAPRLDPVELIPEEAGEEGSTLGRLVIDELGVDEVMFEGVTRDTLKMGPGHMPATPVPGQPGNSVVSGHRTTYGRPFYDLDRLEQGDVIEVETAAGTHVYEVRRMMVVAPTDVYVTEPIPGAWLTLTTCHPAFSAAERLIVQAELVDGPNLAYATIIGEPLDSGAETT